MTRRCPIQADIDDNILRDIENVENKLIDVIEQIKRTLTELLNSEGVKGDRRYRTWVQTRLMNAEKELRGFRSRSYV